MALYERPKIYSMINILAIAIPLFFLLVFLSNPSFEDPLFLTAVIGILLMVIMLFAGLISIIARKTTGKIKGYTYYFAVGIMTLCFGITGIICQIFQQFVFTMFLFIVALLLVGSYIIGDTFRNTRLMK